MLTGTCHCGAAGWTFESRPEFVKACNCTMCRRRGGLWAYDYLDEGIRLSGPMTGYVRGDEPEPFLETLFCAACGCTVAWRALRPAEDGRCRAAVNVRLAPPDEVAEIPVTHFDGLDTFENLPSDGRCVRDLWF